MSHIRFCLFALFAIILAVTLSEAAHREQRDLATWRRKVSACVDRVDKHQLANGEVEILLRCIMPAVARPPWVPQAIAVRYLQCVVGGSATGPLRIAATQVVQCVRNS